MTPADTLVSRARAIDAMPESLTAAELVQQQAEDDGLWFIAQTAAEAYLQQGLRKLHAAVESATCPPVPTFPDQLRNLATKFADRNETHAAMMIRKAADRDEAMEAVLKLIAEHAIFERDGFVLQGPMLLMSKLRRIEELARTAIPRTPE